MKYLIDSEEMRHTSPVLLTNIDEDSKSELAEWIEKNYSQWKIARERKEREWNEVDYLLNERSQTKQASKDLIGLQKGTSIVQGSTMRTRSSNAYSTGMSNTYRDVESFVAMWMDLWFKNGYDFFSINVLNLSDENIASMIKQYMMYVFDQIDLKSKAEPILRQIARYGTGVCSVEWVRKTSPVYEKVPVYDEIGGLQGYGYNRAIKKLYDNVHIQPLDIYNVVWDPADMDISTSNLIIKKYLSIDEYLLNPEYPRYTREELEGMTEEIDIDANSDSKKKRSYAEDSLNSKGYYGSKKLKVLEAWGDFYVNKRSCKNYKAEVLCNAPSDDNNKKHRLITLEPNPYGLPSRPILVIPLGMSPNRVYGDSPLAHVLGHYKDANTLMNQVLDANDMALNRPTIMNMSEMILPDNKQGDGATFDMDATTIHPCQSDPTNALHRMQDPSAVQVSQATIQLMTLTIQSAKDSIALNETNSGGAINPYVKANYAQQVAQGGASRSNLTALSIERGLIEPILKMTIELHKFFMTETTDMMNNETGSVEQFDPTVLSNTLTYSIQGPSFQLQQQQQVMGQEEIFEKILANPMTAPLLNVAKVIEYVLIRRGVREPKNFFVPQAFQMASIPNLIPDFFERVKQYLTLGKGADTQTSQMMQQPQQQQPQNPMGQEQGTQANGLNGNAGGNQNPNGFVQ
jgi:hypothetical protein